MIDNIMGRFFEKIKMKWKVYREKIGIIFFFKYTKFIILLILICITLLWISCKTEEIMISNICGNISAGLIASIIITIYSNMRTEELKEITELIKKINHTNEEIAKFLGKYESEDIKVTNKTLMEAYSKYELFICDFHSLNDEYNSLKFLSKPQPALYGESDEEDREYRSKISKDLYLGNNYEEYLEYMVCSLHGELYQSRYAVNYLLMHLNLGNKLPL